LEYLHSDRILSDVAAGTCDFGIVILPCRQSAKFDIHPFLREKLVCVCSPYHRLASKKIISVKQLSNEPFVTFNKNLQTRQLVDNFFLNNGISVNLIHEGENIETLKRIVEVGGGVSILPEAAVAQEVKNKSLKSLQLKEGPLYRDAGLAVKRGKNLTRAGEVFFQWIRYQGTI
jgi:DNA-binding transcriptional LysR family regulator